MGITLSGQPAGYHERNRVRPGLNLLPALVLNGMGHVDRVKIRTAQRTGLSACRGNTRLTPGVALCCWSSSRPTVPPVCSRCLI